MRRFLAPTAVAGTVVALTLLGGPASAATPDASAAPHSTETLGAPGPWPPAIPPPHCVPGDQSDGTYEWQYSSKRTLGRSTVFEYEISYAVPIVNYLTLSQTVTCEQDPGRVGSGLGL
jgi:hypothetical protein